ncbi:MAG TPA: glutamyl-tRNA reductase [Gaiellaceae bacterium]|jgi:glutamyl-tRNA reductase|nr:glutamyl-tRNA reductase [Gaiellaceae bacterium]
MRLLVVGTSHRLAPIEVRERVALDADGEASLARRLGESGEAVCLSTCNRTELYLGGTDAEAAAERATAALADLGGIARPELEPYLYRLEQEAAATHLFRVAAGLDSLVPGEGEIQGQVRSAYERGAVGPLLDRLFRQALHTGKRVRTETAIGESPASVASAAAALAAQIFGDLAGRRIVVVGAGKTGELAARNLVGRGAQLVFVANRTLGRASSLAEHFGGEALPLGSVDGQLAEAEIVVTATAARDFVLTREQVERALRARRGRPLLLLDLAVPRDVDPAVRELGGCFVYDIDDLQSVVEETLSGRRGEAIRAEAIVAAEGERFSAWLASLDSVPAIASLRERAEAIRRGELAKASPRLAGLSERERHAVESLTNQIVNKLLHQPIMRLKEVGLGEEDERRAPQGRLEG